MEKKADVQKDESDENVDIIAESNKIKSLINKIS